MTTISERGQRLTAIMQGVPGYPADSSSKLVAMGMPVSDRIVLAESQWGGRRYSFSGHDATLGVWALGDFQRDLKIDFDDGKLPFIRKSAEQYLYWIGPSGEIYYDEELAFSSTEKFIEDEAMLLELSGRQDLARFGLQVTATASEVGNGKGLGEKIGEASDLVVEWWGSQDWFVRIGPSFFSDGERRLVWAFARSAVGAEAVRRLFARYVIVKPWL